jgi:hypothetical protein
MVTHSIRKKIKQVVSDQIERYLSTTRIAVPTDIPEFHPLGHTLKAIS